MSTAYFNTTRTLLDNYAIERRNQPGMLMAEKIAPMVGVDTNQKYYPVWGPEFLQTSPSYGVRAPSTAAEEVKLTFSLDYYNCMEHSYQIKLDQRTLSTAQPEFRVEKQYVNLITDKQLVNREYKAASTLFNASNFSGYTAALSGTDRWDNASSDPRVQTDIAKASIRNNGVVDPEEVVLFVSSDVWFQLRKNPAITNITKYSTYQALTPKIVATALGLKDIIVGSGVVADSAGAKTQIWGKYALYGFINENPELEDVSMAKTFILKEKDLRIDSWYNQDIKSYVYRSTWDYDIKITAASSGYLFSTVIS